MVEKKVGELWFTNQKVIHAHVDPPNWTFSGDYISALRGCWPLKFLHTLQMVNGKWLPDFIERLKASAWHQLYLPLLPFTRVRTIVPSYYRIGR